MLQPAMQGQWVLYIGLFTFGLIALGMGLSPAINHYLAAGKLDKSPLVGQLFIFSMVVTALFYLLLLSVVGSNLGAVFLPQVEQPYLLVTALFVHVFLLLFNQLLAAILLAEKKFQSAAWIATLGSLGLLLCYAALYFGFSISVLQFFMAIVFINLLILIIQLFAYLGTILSIEGYSLRLGGFNLSWLKIFVSFALLAYATNLIQFLNYKMDLWFINGYVTDKTQLGVYGVAVSLAQLLWLIPNAFHAVIFTDVSESNNGRMKEQIMKWSAMVFLLALALAVVGYMLSIWFVPVLFGTGYALIPSVLKYLLPGIVLFAPSILWSAYLAGRNKVIINFGASILGFMVSLIGGYLLIPTQGIYGAALITSLSYSLSAVYTFYRFRQVA